MKVSELIKILEECDPERDVIMDQEGLAWLMQEDEIRLGYYIQHKNKVQLISIQNSSNPGAKRCVLISDLF